MYIHSFYKFNDKNENIKFYKQTLNKLTDLNFRRSSKFNILAMYGASLCMENKSPSSNLNIYIASEFGVMAGAQKVIESLQDQGSIVMPFDFLNINGNNAGFSIAKILNTKGDNLSINLRNLSFSTAINMAFNKSKIINDFEVLLGGVEESLSQIKCEDNLKKYTNDISSWLYCNNKKENAIAKITNVVKFSSKLELDYFLSDNIFDFVFITKDKLTNNQHSAYDIISLLEESGRLLHISQLKEEFICIEFIKK